MDKGFAVLEIDPEFKTLIRPLRKDEYLQLEVNLAVDGCREPIITWNNIIVDGHNRYEICNRLHIPYSMVFKFSFNESGYLFHLGSFLMLLHCYFYRAM